MITYRSNSRGCNHMSTKTKLEDMTREELVKEYNRISGKPPIKAFRTAADGIKRIKAVSEATSKPAAKKAAGLAGEFGVRVGSNRAKFLGALHLNRKVKEEDVLKEVYGSKNTYNKGALSMVLKGLNQTIETEKLNYKISRSKNAEKEPVYELTHKRAA